MAAGKAKLFTMGLVLLILLFLTVPSRATLRFRRPRISYSSKRDFLSSHNAVRAAVGVGPLAWNRTVAAYAKAYAGQRAAGGCGMVHSGGPYGENLAAGWSRMTGGEAVKLWATERRLYNHGANSCAGGDLVCGHYTQMVWRQSVRVGCARVKCPTGWMFVICSYDPPGNFVGERPY